MQCVGILYWFSAAHYIVIKRCVLHVMYVNNMNWGACDAYMQTKPGNDCYSNQIFSQFTAYLSNTNNTPILSVCSFFPFGPIITKLYA